jgi:hypothetical protein
MTYKDKFVAEIKLGGKILRVKDDTVYLPFGAEYSLLLKNLDTRRVSVNIQIDGQDVLDNKSLIINSNETTELQGFLRGASATNRFKFIQKTKQIQDHRGDKIDDGLVRIEFAFEKPYEPWIVETIKEVHHKYYPPFTYTYFSTPDWSYHSDQTSGGKNVMRDLNEVQSYNCTIDELGVTEDSLGEPQVDEGITVKGQEIQQDFRYASIGQLEDSSVIIMKLRGLTSHGEKVSQPLTVKTKLTCSTCGTKCKSSSKFCHNCGTFLE